MAELNIETFNTILLKTTKDENAKIKLIEAELELAAAILIDKTAELLEELELKGYKSKIFQDIKNITDNVEFLNEELEKLTGEKEEEKK